MPKKPRISPTLYMTDTLEYTLFIIKPDGMPHRGDIIRNVRRHGFKSLISKRFQLSPEQAAELYQEHEHRKTYMLMVLNMSNGPVEVMLLTREDAIDQLVGLMGPEKPSVARCICPGSLRALYGDYQDDLKNAVHGSLDLDAAKREIRYFFPNFIIDPISRTEGAKICCKAKIIDPLMNGLQQLSKARPSEPIVWLAKWLLMNNPNRPYIQPATSEDQLKKVCVCPEEALSKPKSKASSELESESTSSPSSGTTSSESDPCKVQATQSAIICSRTSSKSSESVSRKDLEKLLCCCNVEVKPGEIAVCPLCEKIIQYTVPTDNVCGKKDSSTSTTSTPDSDGKSSTSSRKSPCPVKKEPCLPCLSKSTSTSPYSTPAGSSTTESDQKCGLIKNFLDDCMKQFASNKSDKGEKFEKCPDVTTP